jgi:glutamate N-acetyltransferase/amino-acid N-acetyltransferase
MLVKDGEGATKILRIEVRNAATEEDAKKASSSIANSLLVKTAFFGKDPNWGRIAMALGKSGANVTESKLDIFIGSYQLLSKGTPTTIDLITLDDYLSRDDISVLVDLNLGTEKWTYLSTDLTYDYIKINAEYTT